jgi:hypothetical protein
MTRWFDRYIIVLFALATFNSVFYEPAFVYFVDCGWQGLSLGTAGPCSNTWVGRAWLAYTSIEPIYANAPLWIQLVNEFDIFLFGWFHVLTIYVFVKGISYQRWYRNLATFMSGMMGYAMTLYLLWQVLSVEQTQAHLPAVLIGNGMWVLFYGSLMARIYLVRDPRAAQAQ